MLSQKELAWIAVRLDTHGTESGEAFYSNVAAEIRKRAGLSMKGIEDLEYGKKKKMIAKKYYSKYSGNIAEEKTGIGFEDRMTEMVLGRKPKSKKMIAKRYYSKYGEVESAAKPKTFEGDFTEVVLGRRKRMLAQKYYSVSDPTDTTIDPTWTTRKVNRRIRGAAF